MSINREEYNKLKLNYIIERQEEYDFDKFLRELRNALGVNRKTVCSDLNISTHRLFFLEHGHFESFPKDFELEKISSYYGFEMKILFDKVQKFLEQGKNSPYSNYVRKRPCA